MKIHNQIGAFFVYRDRKRENRGMKMDKVSPGFTGQPVQGFWSAFTDMIQFNPGTGLTVNLSWKILKKFGHGLVLVQVEYSWYCFLRILYIKVGFVKFCPGQTVLVGFGQVIPNPVWVWLNHRIWFSGVEWFFRNYDFPFRFEFWLFFRNKIVKHKKIINLLIWIFGLTYLKFNIVNWNFGLTFFRINNC